MVQIIPRADFGGQLGQNLGQGLSQGLQDLNQRNIYEKSASNIRDTLSGLMDPQTGGLRADVNPSMAGIELLRATRGNPELMRAVETTILPRLFKSTGSPYKPAGTGQNGQNGNSPNAIVQANQTPEAGSNNGTVPQGQPIIQQNGANAQGNATSVTGTPAVGQAPMAWQPLSAEEANDIWVRSEQIQPGSGTQAVNAENDRRKTAFDAQQAGGAAQQVVKERTREDIEYAEGKLNQQLEPYFKQNVILPEEQQFLTNAARDIFNQVSKDKPLASPQEIWQEHVEPFLTQIRRTEQQGLKSIRSIWKTGEGAYNRVNKAAGTWAKDMNSLMGDKPWVKDYLVAKLDQAQVNHYDALQAVHPMSGGAAEWLNTMPKVGKPFEYEPSEHVKKLTGQTGKSYAKLSPEQVNQIIDSKIDDLGKSMTASDNPLVIRQKLVNDHGMTTEQANDVIYKLNERGYISPSQQPFVHDLQTWYPPKSVAQYLGNLNPFKMFKDVTAAKIRQRGF